MSFVYPVVYDLPISNPILDSGSFLTNMFFITPSNNLEEWRGPRDIVLSHIRDDILQGQEYLPVGTKLYHGSLDPRLTFSKDRITFFGLDVVISLWYIYELSFARKATTGTLYEFITTKPIPVKVLTKIINEAQEDKACREMACIHPQIAIHDVTTLSSNPDPPFDLSIELAVPMKKIRDSMRLVRTYGVDINRLHANKHKTFREYNPTDAIVEYEMMPLRGGRQRTKRRRTIRRKKMAPLSR